MQITKLASYINAKWAKIVPFALIYKALPVIEIGVRQSPAPEPGPPSQTLPPLMKIIIIILLLIYELQNLPPKLSHCRE